MPSTLPEPRSGPKCDDADEAFSSTLESCQANCSSTCRVAGFNGTHCALAGKCLALAPADGWQAYSRAGKAVRWPTGDAARRLLDTEKSRRIPGALLKTRGTNRDFADGYAWLYDNGMHGRYDDADTSLAYAESF